MQQNPCIFVISSVPYSGQFGCLACLHLLTCPAIVALLDRLSVVRGFTLSLLGLLLQALQLVDRLGDKWVAERLLRSESGFMLPFDAFLGSKLKQNSTYINKIYKVFVAAVHHSQQQLVAGDPHLASAVWHKNRVVVVIKEHFSSA